MSQFQQILKKYGQNARMVTEPARIFDQFIPMNSDDHIVFKLDDKGSTAVFPIYDIGTPDYDPLSDSSPDTTTTTTAAYEVPVTLASYGKEAEIINAEALYTAYNSDIAKKLEVVAARGQMVANRIMADAVLEEIPASGNLVHTLGTFDVHTKALVYLGSQTTTRPTRDAITSGDTFTDTKWVTKAVKRLERRGAPKFTMKNGMQLYAGLVHPNLEADIINASSSKWDNLAELIPDYLLNGYVGTFMGVNFYSDPLSVYAGEGDSSGNVFPMTIFGEGYFGSGHRPVSGLASAPGNNMVRIPVNEFLELRLVPAADNQGRFYTASFYFVRGAAILNPKCGFRQEFWASDQSLE